MEKIVPKLHIRLNRLLDDLSDGRFVSSSRLKRRLKKAFHIIRHYYKSLITYNKLEPQDRWIYENYYLIERVYKGSYRSLKNEHFLASNNQNTPDLVCFFEVALGYQAFALEEESVLKLIELFENKRYLHNFEYDFLGRFIKITILLLLAGRVRFGLNADDTAYVSRLIGMLTSVDSIDFFAINQAKNKLEAVLMQDPTGEYVKQNAKTKSLYRYKVAKSAYYENCEELALAKKLIKQASSEKKHVVFFVYEYYDRVKPKNPIANYHRKLCFFGATVLSMLAAAIAGNVLLFLLLYPLAYELLRPLIEKLCLKGSEVTYPPRLELNETVPIELQTLVVISTLLPENRELDGLEDRLTKLYLQNKEGAIGFCLLCDLKSAQEQVLKTDKEQINAVKAVLKKLNQRWDNRFLLMVRSRSYSKTQEEYTGYERKRGAITDLIMMIGGKRIPLAELYGNMEYLYNTKYILTLDYDTKLKMNSVSKLVSIAAHPLNRPVVDQNKSVVTSGYAIISPRMTLDLKSSQKTYFSLIFGGIGGTTTYDASCSEFYQDLYDRAIFSGKGLIDVSAYAKLMDKLFEEETLLSHDIVEGGFLKVLYAGDVELIEGFPSDGISYFKRLDRWIRGDFQNANFLFKNIRIYQGKRKNPLHKVVRFQLFDNLRRAINPIFALGCILFSIGAEPKSRMVLLILAILGTISPYLHGFVNLIISGSISAFTTRFYSNIFPRWVALFYSAMASFMLLPQSAYCSLLGAAKGVYRRFFSKKKMLEWSTSSQVEGSKSNLTKMNLFFLPQIIIGGFLLLIGDLFLKLIGLLFVLALPILFLLKKSSLQKQEISEEITSYLTGNLKKMLGYYHDFAGENDHYLPPDNMQKTPVYRVAHRTSPTNIGLMLLSYLTARDFKMIDSNQLFGLVQATIITLEKLKKYHGNLYNWYDTLTLDPLKPEFVSAVDSGNFLCSLVTLKEGLREFIGEEPKLSTLILQIEALINATDLSVFYDRRKDLFSIGYDVASDALSNSHYDMLMSEARMMSYFAIASRQVPVKHWTALNRTMSRTLFHTGPVSWTGTMFEYFMPELVLHCTSGSIGYEALHYCIACQLKRADQNDVPFGISESAIYSFDDSLNYQYSPNGVQKLALKRGMDDELVISPYSSYLTLPFAAEKSYQNLLRLDLLQARGEYGHYEAIDYTKTRVGNGYAVIKSYMAHHVGMSIVAINNTLNDNIMQRRFLKDSEMGRATELLDERNAVGEIVFEDLFKKFTKKEGKIDDTAEYVGDLFPQQPRVKLLANTDVSCVLTDNGASFIKSSQTDILRRPSDMLRNPKGSFCFLKWGEDYFPTTFAPSYRSDVNYETTFAKSSVEYFARTDKAKVTTAVRLHSILPCEQRVISIENRSKEEIEATLLFYLEPSLAKEADDFAHPAFSKLFINVSRDSQSNTIIAKRKRRSNEELYYMAVGFREDISFDFEANRENLFERGDVSTLKNTAFTAEYLSHSGVPDPCVGIRIHMNFSKGETKSICLLTSIAASQGEAIENIVAMRRQEPIDSERSATSRMLHASLEQRVAQTILPQILFGKRDSSKQLNAIADNRQNPQTLWQLGISTDFPIVLVDVFSATDIERVEVYLKCHALLKLSFIEFDLVFIHEGLDEVEEMLQKIFAEFEVEALISARAGIHIVDQSKLSPELLNLIHAAACHVATRSLVRIEAPMQKYIPVKINKCDKGEVDIHPQLSVLGGGFAADSFFVTSTPKLPWCHILANPTFGTLLSDKALGFTWAINSRENKLTPWYNDTLRDNTGEMLILKLDDEYYDIINGSIAEFSPSYARYHAKVGALDIKTTVKVPSKGMIKYIEVEIANSGDCDKELTLAYYIEPVMGFSRKNSRQITGEQQEGVLLLHNPFNTAVSSYLALTARSSYELCCDRDSFLCGRWSHQTLPPLYDNCAAILVTKKVERKSKHKIDYAMAFSTSKSGALKLIEQRPTEKYQPENSIQIETGDRTVDALVNTWLPWQIAASRLWGRTGFYQCGGAYGFRDQLQDVCGYMLLSPKTARAHIIRCCAAQFEAGDVFHWWHNLPKAGGGKKGVRTRYSDDMVWLSYTLCQYLLRTGDDSILEVKTSYLVAEELKPEQKDNYIEAVYSDYKETVYDHAKKALDRAYQLGKHGLVEIGSGDWNDGYSKVGINGEGESVWLSQFLAHTMKLFADLCTKQNETSLAKKYQEQAKSLLDSVDEYGYDGAYYLRAFFDNGEKMGSHSSAECRIDSLPQSFAAIADMPNKKRVNSALDAAFDNLVDRKQGIIKLFTPSFDSGNQEPGYVKGYPTGVRENGGQYTHAAVWLAIAMATCSKTDKFHCLTKMINPIKRYQYKEVAAEYLLEPYYIAADIYSNEDAYGRGGWSIYTGAASWYYQLLIESMLGIKLTCDSISLLPMLPHEIKGYKSIIRYGEKEISLDIRSKLTETKTIQLENKKNTIQF